MLFIFIILTVENSHSIVILEAINMAIHFISASYLDLKLHTFQLFNKLIVYPISLMFSVACYCLSDIYHSTPVHSFYRKACFMFRVSSVTVEITCYLFFQYFRDCLLKPAKPILSHSGSIPTIFRRRRRWWCLH